jgi:hypothetical protein
MKSYQDKYLSAWAEGRLDWERDWDQSWEQFKLEPMDGDTVAFKSCHGLYISVKGDGTVMCDQHTAGENEAWMVEWAGSGIAIKSRFGKYLHPEKDGRRVKATRDVVTKEEIFTLTAHG